MFTAREFLDELAKLRGVRFKDLIWVVPRGPMDKRPNRFDLRWDAIRDGRLIGVWETVREEEAPETFRRYFSQLA